MSFFNKLLKRIVFNQWIVDSFDNSESIYLQLNFSTRLQFFSISGKVNIVELIIVTCVSSLRFN